MESAEIQKRSLVTEDGKGTLWRIAYDHQRRPKIHLASERNRNNARAL